MLKHRHRRVGVWTSGALAVGLAVAGCGSGSPSNSTSSESGAAKTGDSLAIALPILPPTQGNPFGATYSGPSGEIWTSIFDALTDGAPAGPTPSLALSWKLTSPTVWRFTLRQNVKFSNGEDFNADAVAATYNYLLSPTGAKTAIGAVVAAKVASVSVVSPSVIDIATNGPDPILPREIDQVNIVAPEAWTTLGPAKFALNPVGTGPYQVATWGPTQVTLTNFAGSWHPGHYKKLAFTQIENATSRYQALQSSQIQVDYDLALPQMADIKRNTDLKLIKSQAGKVLAMQYLNKPGSPLLNKEVRQALAMGVDREAFISAVFDGLTTAAYQGASPGDAGYNSKLGKIKYDPAKAKQLLSRAGYPNGFSFELDIAPSTVVGANEMWDALTADYAKIGVNMKVVTLPFATWLSDFLHATFPGEASSIAYSDAPSFDALDALTKGSCLQKPSAVWCQEDQVPVLQQIATQTDPAARQKLFNELQVMERDNPPALFLYNIINVSGVSKSVHAEYRPDGSINFSTLAPA